MAERRNTLSNGKTVVPRYPHLRIILTPEEVRDPLTLESRVLRQLNNPQIPDEVPRQFMVTWRKLRRARSTPDAVLDFIRELVIVQKQRVGK